MSILSTIEGAVKSGLTVALGGTLSPVPGATSSSPGGAAAPVVASTVTQEAANPVKTISAVGNAINSVQDFLKLAAWLVYPLNWVRGVEFLTGMFLFYMGIKPYIPGGRSLGGSGVSRVARTVFDATPPGREVRVAQGTRMGRREGQRESSRMAARREVTRNEREASSRERNEREVRVRHEVRKGYLPS